MVPHPPLLVPELAPGIAEATVAVREACLAAAKRLAQSSAHWVAVGVDSRYGTLGPEVRGSFRPFGVDVPVALSDAASGTGGTECVELPLPALIAGWLREQAGASSVRTELLPDTATVADCVALGERLVSGEDDVALLVLGDGSSRHPSAPPGWADPRAEAFDARVRTALADADADALLAVDPVLAVELQAQGRAAWQVLAGSARTAPGWRGDLLYSAAPFGVAYHVSVWERSR